VKSAILSAFLLVVGAGIPAVAQTFSLQTGRDAITTLDGLWRFHTGDDLAWADPNFNDTSWPLIRSDKSWAEQGYQDYGGYAWYRFTLEVPDSDQPLELLLPGIDTGYQVFANGKLIGGEGSIGPDRNATVAFLPAAYPLPRGSAGPKIIQIAIRVWHDKEFGYPGGIRQPGSMAGAPVVLERELSRHRDARTVNEVASYGYCLLALSVGLSILGLFLSRLDDREYLWFSILLLASGVGTAISIVWAYVSLPMLSFYWPASVVDGTSAIAALFFFSTVLCIPRTLLWRLACIGAPAYPLGLALYYLGWASWGQGHALAVAVMLPADLWMVGTLAISIVRKGASVRWLLAPAVLYYGFHLTGHLLWATLQLGWIKATPSFDPALISRPFALNLSDIVSYVFVLSLLIFLFRRFSAARQEEARLSQEMEAARTVQFLLIPAAPPATPGFAVEHAYLPASEVGGDFFQIFPAQDGSLLVVVGDVSGKGLRAAMTVSAIVGALRDDKARAPGEVLAHLNRVLCGQISGFVTCSAVLIAEDGSMIIANAGHLPPYLNREELPVPNGLPLGVLADAIYEEEHYQLTTRDRLTFISDGVIEARNAAGELLGFDRMAAMTSQSAAVIAQAAQTWGQEDDITVLTIRLAEAAELAQDKGVQYEARA
jgi:hypothetical protein